jgi:hypothetical protein
VAAWRLILAHRQTGVEVHEIIRAQGRRLGFPFLGIHTVAGQLPLSNPAVDAIMAAAAPDRINLLLKAYRLRRDGTWGKPRFVGPLVSANEKGASATLDFAAASPLWLLMHRLIGKSVAGYGDGTPISTKDLGEIMANVIRAANAEEDTGIRIGQITPSTANYFGPVYFKKAGEALLELGPGNLGGPDFVLDPEEPTTDNQGLKIATFRAAHAIGQARPNAVFELGVGRRNMADYDRPVTREGEANTVYNLPQGFPDAIAEGDAVVVGTTPGGMRQTRGLMEDVVSADLGSRELRQTLVDEHAIVRGQARETIVWEPIPDGPVQPLEDFDNGDLIEGRAVVEGRVRFDAIFRCRGIDFALDDQGGEAPSITVTP